MRIIQPSAHILPKDNIILRHVERCGRIAYKSEDAITATSCLNFIERIIESGHESVLEHGNHIFSTNEAGYNALKEVYQATDFDSKWAKTKGYSARLRFSNIEHNHIVSGHIRAWRDFIRVARHDGLEIPQWVQNALHGRAEFGDLDLVFKDSYEVFRPIFDKKDLTADEQFIHWTETVHFICSRAISHELVRHRTLSPTQESQRYCNYSKGKFGGEITFIEPLWTERDLGLFGSWYKSMANAEYDYLFGLENGLQAQESREHLPNSTKTELVMTGTIGDWIHFFGLREAPDAHPEMRRLAIPLKSEFIDNGYAM